MADERVRVVVGQAPGTWFTVDGELVIVDVWRSRADADRFAAERLFPAFERAGVTPDAGTDITAFETAGVRA